MAGRRVEWYGDGLVSPVSSTSAIASGDSARAAAAAFAAGFNSSTDDVSTSSSAVNSVRSTRVERAPRGPWIIFCTATSINSGLFALLRHRTNPPPRSKTANAAKSATVTSVPALVSLTLAVGVEACGVGVGACGAFR